MKLQDKLRRIAASTAVALTIATGAGAALAQPMGGPHGPGPADEMIGRLIAHAKAQLNLNSSQQQMFDAAVAHGKAARESARALHQKVRDTMQAELAKADPDLAAVADAADAAMDQARALAAPVRKDWLRLYATFSVEQKAVVRDMLKQRMARGDSFRQKMRERMHERFGGPTG